MPLIDRILDQNVKGKWSEEVTLPGTAIQIGLSFTGLDIFGDLRDLVYDVKYWDGSLAHAGETLLDAAAFLPVVGMLKNTDEIAALSKQFLNNAPALADAAKYALKNADNLTPGAKRALTTIIVAADRASKAVTAAGKRAGDAVQSAAKKAGDRLEELYRKLDEEWFKGEILPRTGKSYNAAKTANWKKPDGSTWWPDNDGFADTPTKTTLQPGTKIDRYGKTSGKYAAPEGTPYKQRSLAPGSENSLYNSYEVVKPFDVDSGKTAPWFDQPGGGTQYQLPMSIQELRDLGFIRLVIK